MKKALILLFALSAFLPVEARSFKLLLSDAPVADSAAVCRIASAIRKAKPDFAVVRNVRNEPGANRSAQLAGACEMHVVFGVAEQTPDACTGTAILSEYSFDKSDNHRPSRRLAATATPRNQMSVEIIVTNDQIAVSPAYRITSFRQTEDGTKIAKIKSLKTR